MSKSTICIITQLHPSMNPRLVKDADALTDAGYKVAVIAPDFSAWGREADREFEDRAWKIVERPRFGPLAPPATRLVELARRAIAGIAVKQLRIECPALVRAAWHPVAPALVAAAKNQKAALYLAHLVSALPAAAIAAEHHDARYAFDAEDFHPGDLPNAPEYAAENRMVRHIEGRYLPGCAYVTAASPGIADAYAKEYGIPRPIVVLNAFPRSRAPDNWSPAGAAVPSPSVYWFSQTIGPGRGVECAVKAIARSQARPHLYLRGAMAAGFARTLEMLAASVGVTDRIHILAPASPQDMEKLAAIYDMGLSGEAGHTANNRIALGNKLFSYLLAGIPILMSSSPAHEAFATELGEAAQLFPIDDAAALARVMDEWLLDPQVLARARQRAWMLGQQRFNWDLEAANMVRAVERVIPRSSGSGRSDRCARKV